MDSFKATSALLGGFLVPNVRASLQSWQSLASFVPSTFAVLSALFLGYVALCSALRFRFEKATRIRFNFPDRASLASMTNDEAQAILSAIALLEFPLLYKTSIQLALFKTYGIPTISKTIVSAKSFSDLTSAPKRYEDTVVIYSLFSLSRPTSEECIKAIARMNYLHSPYIRSGQIKNADLLYTLAVSFLEPIRFIGLFDWRPLNEMEIAALGTFWKALGDAMHIEYKGYLARESWRDGIEFVEDVAAWAKQYEVDCMKPDAINVGPSRALVAMLTHLLPGFMKPFTMQVISVVMGQRLREAFLYPEPSATAGLVAYAALLGRKLFVRYLMLPRITPVPWIQRDQITGRMRQNTYLVHPWYMKPTVWNRWGPVALLTRLLGGTLPGDEGDKYLPQGFRYEDLGPTARMGKGKEEMAQWEEVLGRERTSGCPFGPRPFPLPL